MARKDSRNPSDRLHNHLPLTHGSRGTGKSFLLDELAAFRNEDRKLCPPAKKQGETDADVNPILSHMVSVLITYNTDTDFDERVDMEETCARGLCLRMLWR